MVHKILAYENNPPPEDASILLVADDPDEAGDFTRNAEQLSTGVLDGRPQRKIYLEFSDAASARTDLISSFNEGASIVSYIGHGAIHLWAQENIFNTADISSLSPQAQQPLLLTMNCLNGYFHFPYFDALAEAAVKAKGRGAVAAISPTGMSVDAHAHRFHRAILTEILGGKHLRLGDALMDAQKIYADQSVFPELLSIYHLFGDPALQLR